MISFACTCGEKFEAPQSAAGDQFQCPRCMRLVDIPQLSELGMIAEDGTFKLYDVEPTPSDLGRKMIAFAAQDDLRGTVDDFLTAGALPPDITPIPGAHGPRYDPETGERVLPMELKADVVRDTPENIPMATPVLAYSSAAPAPGTIDTAAAWWQMPWRLLSGMNLFAVFFVFLAQVMVHLMLLIPAGNLLLVPFDLAIVALVLAHYCNTVEDFGANRRDHVPVMFRNGSISEDVLHPLMNLLMSAVMAFAPFVIATILIGWPPRGEEFILLVGLFWAGIFMFPALIFTATCSGAIQNMTPRRVLSVIFAAPVRYLWAAITFGAACVAYLIAIENFGFTSVAVLQGGMRSASFSNFAVSAGLVYGLLAVATYLMHLAAVWLGSIYGSHYEKFNWILQRHEPQHRGDTNARLADMRRRGDPRVSRHKTAPPQPERIRPVQSIEQ